MGEISTDPRTNEHRPGGPPSDREAEDITAQMIRDWDAGGIGYWVIEYGDRIVGIAGIRPTQLGSLSCWNLYYRFAPEAWGQGFAAEVAREAVAMAGELRPVRPVVARTRPDNASAIRVAQAAGMERRADFDGDGFVAFATVQG